MDNVFYSILHSGSIIYSIQYKGDLSEQMKFIIKNVKCVSFCLYLGSCQVLMLF